MAPFSNLERPFDIYNYSDDGCDDESDTDVSSCSASETKEDGSVRSSISSSSGSRKSSSSTVSFATEAAVYSVLHINDFTCAEKRDAWYGSDDLRRIRLENKEIVQSLERRMISDCNDDSNDDDEYFCCRGLEGKTCMGKRQRREVRAYSLEIVLDEQVYQELDDGHVDPVMIAMAYHEFTFSNQVEAFQQGQRDAKSAGIQSSSTEEDQPKKFDFRAVLAKCMSTKNHHHDKKSCYDDDDATVATAIMTMDTDSLEVGHPSNNKDFLFEGNTNNNSFRKRFSSCFMPLTPKRYARRRPRTTTKIRSPSFSSRRRSVDV